MSFADYLYGLSQAGAVAIWPMDDPPGTSRARELVVGGDRNLWMLLGTFGVTGPFPDATAWRGGVGDGFMQWPAGGQGALPPLVMNNITACFWFNGEGFTLPGGGHGLGWAAGLWQMLWWYWQAGGFQGGGAAFPGADLGFRDLRVDEWIHVATVLGGGQHRLVINGETFAQAAATLPNVAPTYYYLNNDPRVAGLALFDRALTNTEIQDILSATAVATRSQAWTGSAWVSGRVQGWDGSQWRPAKVWDGQGWREL